MSAPRPVYLGNYPNNRDTDWTDGLQGVAHDEAHWYFTQKTKIFKFHVTTPLTRGSGAAVEMARMPSVLARAGGDHFGDPDFVRWRRRGYLLSPGEGEKKDTQLNKRPRLAVFSTDGGLRFVGAAAMPRQNSARGTGRAGWCAVHPRTRLVYSSDNVIGKDNPVFRYRLDFAQLARGRVRLTAERDFRLTVGPGRLAIIPPYLQGGTFSPGGHLYLINGTASGKTSAQDGGIRVFDGRGRLIARSVLGASRTNRFRYQYDPGFPTFQEPEGITWWDLTAMSRRHRLPSQKMNGQLHAILLNSQVGKDNIWFKHYRVA